MIDADVLIAKIFLPYIFLPYISLKGDGKWRGTRESMRLGHPPFLGRG